MAKSNVTSTPALVTAQISDTDCVAYFKTQCAAWQGSSLSLICSGSVAFLVAAYLGHPDASDASKATKVKVKDVEASLHVACDEKGLKRTVTYAYVADAKNLARVLFKRHQFGGICGTIAQSKSPQEAVNMLLATLKAAGVATVNSLRIWGQDAAAILAQAQAKADKAVLAARELSRDHGSQVTKAEKAKLSSAIKAVEVARAGVNSEAIVEAVKVLDKARGPLNAAMAKAEGAKTPLVREKEAAAALPASAIASRIENDPSVLAAVPAATYAQSFVRSGQKAADLAIAAIGHLTETGEAERVLESLTARMQVLAAADNGEAVDRDKVKATA